MIDDKTVARFERPEADPASVQEAARPAAGYPSRRDVLKGMLAGAAALLAAPLLPTPERWVPFSGMQLSHFPETCEDWGGWSTFEWDDTPLDFPTHSADDAFEAVHRFVWLT